MSYRLKYNISIGLFIGATLYMLYIQGQATGAAASGSLGAWHIFEIVLSFTLLIAAIIAFIYYRSHKDSRDVSEEELLLRATKPVEKTNKSSKP